MCFSKAQDRMDEKPDDYRRRPQVQADLRPGHLFSGDPEARQLRRWRVHLQSQERPRRSHRQLQGGDQT